MNNEHKPKGTSITEAASKMVSEWSNSKKAAFEQRTGLSVSRGTQLHEKQKHSSGQTNKHNKK